MKQLHEVGAQAARGQTGQEGEAEVMNEELFKASDEAIDLMKEAIRDEETFKKVLGPVKDLSDK
jgi:hypothetical protein